MPFENVRPTTLSGIKSLAKHLKVSEGVSHAAALDLAARRASYENFRHARNRLQYAPSAPRETHRVYLTSYWNDDRAREQGRETMVVELSVPWSGLGKPADLKRSRYLGGFKFLQPDHLVDAGLRLSQSAARSTLCSAARALTFMDLTGLRPTTSSKPAFPKIDGREQTLPGRDHATHWVDPATRRYVIADEPYAPAEESRRSEREEWALQNGFRISKPAWQGMYNPDGGAKMFLVARVDDAQLLQRLVDILDRALPPVVEGNWGGESGPYRPTFRTPAEQAFADRAQAYAPRDPTLRRPSPSTAPYSLVMSGLRRRPASRMPIAAHKQVGRLLGEVYAMTYYRKGVYHRIDAIRGELDNWAQCEYNHEELSNQEFFSLYYAHFDGSHSRVMSSELREANIKRLRDARRLLEEHYPACEPRKRLSSLLDSAIGSLQTWLGKSTA